MTDIYLILGGAAGVIGLTLALFLFFRGAGINAQKIVALRQEAIDNEKLMDEIIKANKFRNRVATDPGYLELMRSKLNKGP